MILITGDSWARGEGMYHNGQFEINHGGLAQYLSESGHSVCNLARSGSSNMAALQRIWAWRNRNPDQEIESILFFNTDYARDFDVRHPGDQERIKTADTLAGILIARFYSDLAHMSKVLDCPVNLIGACADCLWLDDMHTQYPGVHVVCQSMTNLLINGNDRVDQPVLSWYTKDSLDMVQVIRQYLEDQHEIARLMDLVDLGMERESLLLDHPKLFWPDGVHPNRHGHRILFDYLVQIGTIRPSTSQTSIGRDPI